MIAKGIIMEVGMEYKKKLALIVAFYLSKYDVEGVKRLGYSNFSDTFRRLSEILEVKSNSIKQMREQFDPYHDNTRVGWYQRPLSRSRRDVMNQYGGLSEAALREIVLEILKTTQDGAVVDENYTKYISDTEKSTVTNESTSAYTTRGITGQTAEELFLEYYEVGKINGFRVPIRDTRLHGTGYDFEMTEAPYYVFEVKGLRAEKGSILFTDHEWKIAQNLKDKYFVVLFSNLDDEIKLNILQNPYKVLQPKMQNYPVMHISWQVGTEDFHRD